MNRPELEISAVILENYTLYEIYSSMKFQVLLRNITESNLGKATNSKTLIYHGGNVETMFIVTLSEKKKQNKTTFIRKMMTPNFQAE